MQCAFDRMTPVKLRLGGCFQIWAGLCSCLVVFCVSYSVSASGLASRATAHPLVNSHPMTSDANITQLQAEIRACQACRDLPLGPFPLFQIGAEARILIAGQAPGRRTHLAGRVFDDASGVRLRAWLGLDEATFRDPEQVAVVPMGFCYPGTGRGGDLPPRAECAPLWRARVLSSLGKVRLTIVLGRYAQAWHLPETVGLPLSTVARDWHAHWPERVLLPHPSPRNAGWVRKNPWFEAELLPALRAQVASILAAD